MRSTELPAGSDSPMISREEALRKMAKWPYPSSMRELLEYEIFSSPLVAFISWGWLQEIVARHFSRRVRRKHSRWAYWKSRSELNIEQPKVLEENFHEWLGDYFYKMRMGKEHLAMGDIRLTVAQQEDLVVKARLASDLQQPKS